VAKAASAIKAPPRNEEKASLARRAFRGLLLPLTFSFINFAGLLLSALSLKALGDWTTWQFAGMFGIIEASQGLASIVQPNIWHLPVVELEKSDRTRTKLAWSTIFLPHWGGAARAFAGTVIIVASAVHHGDVQATAVLIVLLVIVLAALWVNVTMLVARLGVAHAGTDVVQLLVKWRGETHELKPLSIGASLLQFALGIMTLPIANTLSSNALYDPGIRLEPLVLIGTLIVTAAASALNLFLWRGRFAMRAPREQQVEVEQNA
jgi:hypothetical protein